MFALARWASKWLRVSTDSFVFLTSWSLTSVALRFSAPDLFGIDDCAVTEISDCDLCQNFLTWHGHAVICGRRWLIFDAVRTHHCIFSRLIKKKIFGRNKLENSEKTQRSFTVVLDGFEVFSVKHSNRYPYCRIQFKISLVSLASRSLPLGPHLLNLSSDSVRLTLTSLR